MKCRLFFSQKSLISWVFSVVSYCLISCQITALAQIENLSSLIELGRYGSAERLLLTLKNRAKRPGEVNDINHRLGELYYLYTHQYLQALVAYENIIGLPDGHLADDRYLAQIKRGDVFCRIGQHKRAIQAFQSLMELVPSNHFAHQTAQLRIRTIQDALAKRKKYQLFLNQSTEPKIDKAEAKFRMAELYRQPLNQPQEAVSYYNQVVAEFPGTRFAPESLWRMGNVYNRILHQTDLAITHYQQVENQYPTCAFASDSIYQIARIYCRKQQFRVARPHLEKVIDHYPSFWKMYAVFYWLGLACESPIKIENADYRSSINAYKTFLNLYLPELESTDFGEIAKHQLDRQTISTQIERKIAQLEANLPVQEWQQFEFVISEQNFSTALNIGRRIIADFPNTKYAKKVRTQIPKITKQAAIQQLKKTPDGPATLLQMGLIYEHELQNSELALDVYGQLVKTCPDSDWVAEALYRMGIIHLFEYKNIGQAIELYNTLTRQYAYSMQAMQASFQLGEIYRHLQQFDLAVPAYQLTAKHIEQELYLGDGFQDSFADQAEFRIAAIYYQQKDWHSALNAFQDFLRNRPNSPRLAAACTYLGLIYQSTKQKSKAIAAWQRAIDVIQIQGPIQSQMVMKELKSTESMEKIRLSNQVIRDNAIPEPITASRTTSGKHEKNKADSSQQPNSISRQVIEWLHRLQNH